MDLIKEYWRKFHKTKDIEWIGKILDHYKLILFGVAMKYIKEPEGAKDVVQEVFLIALQQMPKTKIDNIGGWLYTVTRNEALKRIKWTDQQRKNAVADQEAPIDETTVDQAWSIEKKEEELWKAIEDLNEDQKTCIIGFYIQNKSYQEIVALSKYSLKEVKSHLQNGKRNLKNKLGDHPLFK